MIFIIFCDIIILYLLKIFVKSYLNIFLIYSLKDKCPFTWEQFVIIFESNVENYK